MSCVVQVVVACREAAGLGVRLVLAVLLVAGEM